MKSQKSEWRKELRMITRQRRAIISEADKADAELCREIKRLKKARSRAEGGHDRALRVLRRREDILLGRLS
jgi:hypothetical protein